MTVSITKKISSVSLKSKENTDESILPVQQSNPVAHLDIDPLYTRIDKRPETALNAVTEKLSYYTQEGKKTVYIIVSFIEVEGVVEGNPVIIERPIEFFYPVLQNQWIVSTMRSLSLAARGGYVSQALKDLRKVCWDKGPVRFGSNAFDKPIYHDSEVAAIAFALQRILQKRGFLDVEGNQVPARVLSKKLTTDYNSIEFELPSNDVINQETCDATKNNQLSCPTCESEMIIMDGCPTCTTCGYSKCG